MHYFKYPYINTNPMSIELIIAAIIFIATYALIAIRRVGKYKISFPIAAAVGGLLMILFGIVSLNKAWDAINFDTLFILLGMMLVVASLDCCGFFELVANNLMSWSMSGKRFLVYVMIISAVLSAIMLNDAVVLLFTPIVIRCCRKAGANPIPLLVGVFVSANIGSVATVIGNPQNAYIAMKAGISFIDFSAKLLPIAVVCMIVACLMLLFFFGKKLEFQSTASTDRMELDRMRLYLVLAVTLVAIVCFGISSFVGWKLPYIALIAGVVSLLIVSTKGLDTTFTAVKSVNWGILLFFIGLFILVAGVVESGLLDEIRKLFPGFSEGSIPSILDVTVFGTILSNLVSNVPAAMLIGELIPLNEPGLWLTLAACTTIAGNLTLIGAAANVIVVEESEKEDIRIGFFEFMKIGVPLTLVTLAIMTGMLYILA